MDPKVIWLIICIVLVLIECATMGLTTIWVAIGAFVAMIGAMIGVPIWAQRVLFVVVSGLLLIYTRPIATKRFNKDREKTNVEAIIGKQGIVVTDIDNLNATGTVTVDGQEWTARTEDSHEKIEAGAVVLVREVEGVKLIVEQRIEEN